MANNLSAFDVSLFSQALVANLDKMNVMLPLVNRAWEGDLSRGVGSTVYVRTLGSIQLTPFTKGQTITYTDLTPAKEAFTVNTVENFAFAVDDIDAAQNDINALEVYAKRAAIGVTEAVEKKILAQYQYAHVDNRITGAANADVVLDADNIYSYFVQARGRLSKQSVPMYGRYAIVDTDTYSLLLNAPEFRERQTSMGDSTITNGSVGSIAGFDVYESQHVPTSGGSKYLLFADRDAIAYAGQVNSVETIRLETTYATACRGLLLHEAKVFAENSKRMATIKVAA